jgi:hypothetical protein
VSEMLMFSIGLLVVRGITGRKEAHGPHCSHES